MRNIAIIAHVDHGKTTLVDGMLRQGGVFRDNQHVDTRIMDSGDLERERGITILAKNASAHYKDVKINIIDTPGHADFGGEVERVLKMAGGVLLLVDAAEGPMPQTRFVLERALELDLKIIIVVNKVDRPDARTEFIAEEILELLIDLNAGDEHLESPIIYCSGRDGWASADPTAKGENLAPLFEAIINHVKPPSGEADAPLQLLVSSVDYSDYVGRLGIGRIERGTLRAGQEVTVCDALERVQPYRAKIAGLYGFEGLGKVQTESASVGDIVCFTGAESINIGNTVCPADDPQPLPFARISQPTMEMVFSVNDSPFAGKEGKFVTTRHLKARLERELLKDVSLRVLDTGSADSFRVLGRGEMHLSILIETMRREGYEFIVGTPRVIFREEDGVLCEPFERLVADVPQSCVGAVMEGMGERKGELLHMTPMGSRIRLEFSVPARGLLGYKSQFLTDTKGEGVLSPLFDGYKPVKGDMPRRRTGSLVAYETGEAVTYGLHSAQDRGTLFITPGTQVYEGMVVGMSPKNEDIRVNVCKKKHVTNIRASGSDDALRLNTPRRFSLEEAIEFIADDELLEITPQNVRIRKTILSGDGRLKAQKAANPKA